MSHHLEELVNKIGQCIFTIHNPSSNQEAINQAHLWLDQIIVNSNDLNLSLQVAFQLIEDENNTDPQLASFVRHFGLQLIENRVKFNWSNLSEQVQNELKLQLERLIFDSSLQVIERFLKDALSKCVVETMKREWPQKWPLLLNQMIACKRNNIVLFTLGRLLEDVAIFYSPANSERRREIHSELTSQHAWIMQYISDCLISGQTDLCTIALETLNPFLEFFNFDSDTLTFLCDILSIDISNDTYSKVVKATDCLLTCLNRKGFKMAEKSVLLSLFSDKNLSSIFNCIELTFVQFFNLNDHQAFDLAKRLCSLISLMGQTASNLYPDYKLTEPTWKVYLQRMYSLLQINNHIFNSFIVQFWRDILKNFDLKTSLITEQMVSDILVILPNKLIKKSWDDDLMGFEFDGNEDYEIFYYKFRAEILDLLRALTLHNQSVCFLFASSFVIKLCVPNQPNYEPQLFEWEQAALLLDSVCNKLTKLEDFASNGLTLLSYLLSPLKTGDLEIISNQLTCISALSIFLPYANDPNIWNCVFQKIFTLATIEMPGQDEHTRCKFVKNLRRHASFFFTKLCLRHAKLLLPLFSVLKGHIDSYLIGNQETSQVEICAFNEGLAILSNHFDDQKAQECFLQEITLRLKWFLEFFPSPQSFITYIGLDQSPDDYDKFTSQRSRIVHVSLTLSSLLKKITNRSILLQIILPFINPLSNLISILNSLWDVKIKETCHSLYIKTVFAPISESEKLSLLDLPPISAPFMTIIKPAPLRMQHFLWTLYENTFSTLGQATVSLNPEIYLEYKNINSAVYQIYNLPNVHLRLISRTFIKPLISNCPNDLSIYSNLLLPFLKDCLPLYFSRINSKWEQMKARQVETREDEDKLENEIVEEKLLRLLSRDYIEIISLILIAHNVKKSNSESNLISNDYEMADCNENKLKGDEEKLSDLGLFAINNLLNVITMTIFISLTWLDSLASLKAAFICTPLLKKLITEDIIKNVSEVEFFLDKILKAFSYFGEHDHNQAVYLQLFLIIYEGLVSKPSFQIIKPSLAAICGCDLQKWNEFELKWINAAPKVRTATFEKKRREALKRLLSLIIGKNIGQLGKKDKDESIKLPPLRRKKVSKSSTDEWSNCSLDLCNLFE